MTPISDFTVITPKDRSAFDGNEEQLNSSNMQVRAIRKALNNLSDIDLNRLKSKVIAATKPNALGSSELDRLYLEELRERVEQSFHSKCQAKDQRFIGAKLCSASCNDRSCSARPVLLQDFKSTYRNASTIAHPDKRNPDLHDLFETVSSLNTRTSKSEGMKALKETVSELLDNVSAEGSQLKPLDLALLLLQYGNYERIPEHKKPTDMGKNYIKEQEEKQKSTVNIFANLLNKALKSK